MSDDHTNSAQPSHAEVETPAGREEKRGTAAETSRSLSRRGPRWFRWVRSIVIIYTLVHVGLFFIQRKLLYVPYQNCELSERARTAGVREVWFDTEDGLRLAAWYWPAEASEDLGSGRSVTALVCHGNAGHRGHRLRWMQQLRRLGLNVLVFDYRGYGDNPGSPSEEGLYLDAKGALRWLQQNVEGEIVYFGYSLGSGVASELARAHPPAALVLQAPFMSVPLRAAEMYPFLWIKPLVRDEFANVNKVGSLRMPKLIIHGDRDEVVPVHHGERIFEVAREPQELWIRVGLGHERLTDDGEYRSRVREFLAKYELLP